MKVSIQAASIKSITRYLNRNILFLCALGLTGISIYSYVLYLQSGLGLNYNDARSHLDIGRRVVEGLKPGLAQLGSVWLPLNHVLMIPLIWNDWAWHSGFAGAIWNMISFVGTGIVIVKYLERLKVGIGGRLIGVALFAANINILYLQSTAMTEPLLIFTMTVGCYYLLLWHEKETILDLVKAAFWIMLATLVRYDGWFLLGFAVLLVIRNNWTIHLKPMRWSTDWKKLEGNVILFGTLAGVGVLGWFAWNQLIFRDALYFMLGPYSAHAQQEVMEAAGSLATKWDLLLSLKVYLYSLFYSSYTFPVLMAAVGMVVLWRDKTVKAASRWSTTSLLAPLIFNILALYLGFSVIFVQGISGDSWFNIRYGTMLAPTIAIFIGYLFDRAKSFRPLVFGTLLFVLFFAFVNQDAVSIDDAQVGSSQKNVSEVAGYLNEFAKDKKGFILISAASHDAIIFSSGLPMKRFIHEGTGLYWENALNYPDRWARWIIMRTHDNADQTWREVSKSIGFYRYSKVKSYPFADIYELDEKYLHELQTEAVIKVNK